MTAIDLSVDEVLTTTRAVRKRLDLERPVPRDLVEECIEIGLQAPTGSNAQGWHFVVVDDADRRRDLAEIYRKAWALYEKLPRPEVDDPAEAAQNERVRASAAYLADRLQDVPVHVIPCIEGRFEAFPAVGQASMWGSVFPAVWNFQLACRSRGLGTSLTTMHLFHEREAAEVVGIPYDSVSQAALLPVAYTIGTEFKAARRRGGKIHWGSW